MAAIPCGRDRRCRRSPLASNRDELRRGLRFDHADRLPHGGRLAFADPEAHYAHPTRQDDPRRWAFGNLYWFRRESFLETHAIETGVRVGLPVDALSALDLNTPDDWRLAEALLTAGLS